VLTNGNVPMERSPVWCGSGCQFFFNGHFLGRIDFSARSSTVGHKGVPCLALPLPSSRGEGRLVASKRQKPPKRDQQEGYKGPRPIEKIPKNTIFQNTIQKNSFPENFTWVEAVRKNPQVELFILGLTFPQWPSTRACN
jgi:hypothetical protein